MATLKCTICSKSPANGCATCKSAAYCSKKCQTIDWPLHKSLCKKFTKLPPRPSSSAKLGILLAANDPEPRFVWVPCKRSQSGSSKIYDEPLVNTFLENPISGPEKFNVLNNEVRGYSLDHAVILFARDNWLNDGSKPNQAALALTEWQLPYDWRGNLLIMSYEGDKNIKPPTRGPGLHGSSMSVMEEGGLLEPFMDYQDVNMADLRSAVDYLNTYGKATKRGTEHDSIHRIQNGTKVELSEMEKLMQQFMKLDNESDKNKKVKGVVIRCEGDIGLAKKKTGKWERYSETNVAKDHAIWDSEPTAASKMMGLPLLLHKLPPNAAWNQNDHTRFDNQPTTFLNIAVDPKDPSFGFAPPQWQSEVGSVLLVRKDGKDLSREQAWALAEFMQFRVSDSFETAMESGEVKDKRAAVLRMLNWSRFDNFLENFKDEMTSGDGKSWANVRSPFGTKEGSNGPF